MMLFLQERTIHSMVRILLPILKAQVEEFNSQQILEFIKMEPKKLIKRVSQA
jgi:hypothetical protein